MLRAGDRTHPRESASPRPIGIHYRYWSHAPALLHGRAIFLPSFHPSAVHWPTVLTYHAHIHECIYFLPLFFSLSLLLDMTLYDLDRGSITVSTSGIFRLEEIFASNLFIWSSIQDNVVIRDLCVRQKRGRKSLSILDLTLSSSKFQRVSEVKHGEDSRLRIHDHECNEESTSSINYANSFRCKAHAWLRERRKSPWHLSNFLL